MKDFIIKYQNWLFNLAHTFITILAVFDAARIVGRDFPEYELYACYIIGGGFLGWFLARVWDYVFEEQILKMPSSKADIINMAVSGLVGGLLAVLFTIADWALILFSIISTIFIIWYFIKMYKMKQLFNK